MKRTILVPMAVALALIAPQVAHARPGDIDSSFGVGGFATLTNVHPNTGAFDVAAGYDGNLVVVGEENSKPLLAGLTTQGFQDTHFGESSYVTDVPWGCRYCRHPLLSVVRQGSGFLVSGVSHGSGVVARIDAEGNVDTNWAGGRGYAGASGVVWDLALTPGGKILIVTSETVERLMPTGEVDQSFGDRGIVEINEGRSRRSRLAADQIDVTRSGDIFVAGSENRGGYKVQRVFVANLEKSGVFDTSFGSRGDGVIFPGNGYSTDIGSNKNGLYVSATLMAEGRPHFNKAAVFKLGFGGQMDRAFGDRGLVKSPSDRSYSSSMLVTGDRLVVQTGLVAARRGGRPPLRLSLMTTRGKLDRQFGNRGRAEIPGVRGGGMTMDDDGGILIAGSRTGSKQYAAVVVRVFGE